MSTTKSKTIDSLVRVSRVNGRELKSDRLQRDGNEHAITGHGYQLGRHVEALNVSGGLVATGDQWQAALDRVRSGESAGVAVAFIDRLSRDVATGLPWADALGHAGGVLIGGGRLINMANPHERFMFISELNNGELQLNIYKVRSREVMTDVQKRGIANRLNYGYARNGATDPSRDPKAFVIDPVKADTVKTIFLMRGAGEKWSTIIKLLHSQGVPSPTGESYWTTGTLAEMVKNRVYVGEVHMGGHVTRKAHKRIVTEAQWKAAQSKAVKVRNGKHAPGVAHGLLTCTGCGNPLSVQSSGDGHTFYGCRRNSSAGPCPAPVTGKQSTIDDYVDDQVERALNGGHVLDVVKAQQDLTALKEAMDAAIEDELQYHLATAGKKADVIAKAIDMHADRVKAATEKYNEQLDAVRTVEDLPVDGAAYRALPVAWRRKTAADLIDHIDLMPFPKGANKALSVASDRLDVHWA